MFPLPGEAPSSRGIPASISAAFFFCCLFCLMSVWLAPNCSTSAERRDPGSVLSFFLHRSIPLKVRLIPDLPVKSWQGCSGAGRQQLGRSCLRLTPRCYGRSRLTVALGCRSCRGRPRLSPNAEFSISLHTRWGGWVPSMVLPPLLLCPPCPQQVLSCLPGVELLHPLLSRHLHLANLLVDPPCSCTALSYLSICV